MEFINSKDGFPFSDAVIYSGRVLETVLTGIPKGEKAPVEGGAEALKKSRVGENGGKRIVIFLDLFTVGEKLLYYTIIVF